MHFISNRAIVLADGESAIQIAYSPGFTTLSFFVPILVLLTAFTALGSDDRVSLVRVTVGGTLAGLAICGMHYLGQAGISNYISVYSVGNVVGSAVVAVVASIVALSVFFVLRATWTNSWWKRALCAIILAGAVFGMHWLASVGTQYRLKHADLSSSHNISRNSTVIVVIVLVCTIATPTRRHANMKVVYCGLLHPNHLYIACTEEKVSLCQQSSAGGPGLCHL
jgi:NO-binding membrane sensor protein with MHYT domain